MARHIIIAGCGRLGRLLAGDLSTCGDSVVIIDRDDQALKFLPVEFSGFRIQGDAVSLEVLRQAKIEHADALVAATDRDNVNLMIAQVAQRLFGVHRVVARVYDPFAERLYRRLGIVTVSPTLLSHKAFFQVLNPSERTSP